MVHADPWVAHSLIADIYAQGPRVPGRRRLPPAPALRRLRHEHGHRRRLWTSAGSWPPVLQGWGGARRCWPPTSRSAAPCTSAPSGRPCVNYATVGNQLVRPALEARGSGGRGGRGGKPRAPPSSPPRPGSSTRSASCSALRYDGSPVLVPDGTAAAAGGLLGAYVPTACPGGRAPHLPGCADGSSLYRSLRAAASPCWRLGGADRRHGPADGRRRPARRRRNITAAGRRQGGRAASARPPTSARFALIRPDQHVAWRGNRHARTRPGRCWSGSPATPKGASALPAATPAADKIRTPIRLRTTNMLEREFRHAHTRHAAAGRHAACRQPGRHRRAPRRRCSPSR